MSTPVLRLEKLRKSFGAEVVLEDITFSVPEHTATVFIGASGSGKSTLLRCINLLEQIDDGQILLDGVDISAADSNPDEVRKKLGMVFQSFNLFPHMTVLENIILAPTRVQGVGKEQAIDEANQLLDKFGLREKANQYPDRLSGGQQQRVAIIRSLARHPRLLLLDEPLEGLAPIIVQELLRAIARITREEGLSAIIVEQHPQAILKISHQAVVLDHGTVVHRGSAQALLDQPELLDRLLGVARVD